MAREGTRMTSGSQSGEKRIDVSVGDIIIILHSKKIIIIIS